MAEFPNTGTLFEEQRTNSGLSTQIIVKINNTAVGALQNLRVSQSRDLRRINEIGTDGNIEIVPSKSTEYTLSAERVVFDQLRLPEAFSRGFRFIAAQRVPFDIEIFDIGSVDPAGAAGTNSNGLIVMTYKNCWFSSYETPYEAENYVITESAEIWAETAFISNLGESVDIPGPNRRSVGSQTDAQGIENSVNAGGRRGALDASGIVNSLFA